MKIAFIGGGTMVQALIKGLNNHGITAGVWMRNKEKLQQLSAALNVTPIQKLSQLETYDCVILGVTPDAYRQISLKLDKHLKEHHILVSMIDGISIEELDDVFDMHPKIIRMMPNTPVSINQGVVVMSHNEFVTEKELRTFEELMSKLGYVHWIEERLMDAIPSVTGSSPAFIYMLIEAMADNAVSTGINRQLAYDLVSEMMIGAASMVQQTKQHPGQLKDEVTTPGGSTIRGVKALEKAGFRNAVSEAMDAVNNRGE
ncbi:pyrroline-5-carboxylate reductase [Macrococcoides canis]|uniref:pyrroline-5-carboxylate reductase n=1 Tax=Macrococcoides canis TaxID=1855823 RepID=UPI001B8D013C|nr:pyrroline-5-carboxylate reductase [Macrococcus canis]QUR94408.1 pyrroline-5-carboxylate reductase [Macrococcus canis]